MRDANTFSIWFIRLRERSWLLAIGCLLDGFVFIWQGTSPAMYVFGGFGLGIGVTLLCVGRLMSLHLRALRQQREREETRRTQQL